MEVKRIVKEKLFNAIEIKIVIESRKELESLVKELGSTGPCSWELYDLLNTINKNL